jgi:hypothetical protein
VEAEPRLRQEVEARAPGPRLRQTAGAQAPGAPPQRGVGARRLGPPLRRGAGAQGPGAPLRRAVGVQDLVPPLQRAVGARRLGTATSAGGWGSRSRWRPTRCRARGWSHRSEAGAATSAGGWGSQVSARRLRRRRLGFKHRLWGRHFNGGLGRGDRLRQRGLGLLGHTRSRLESLQQAVRATLRGSATGAAATGSTGCCGAGAWVAATTSTGG